MQAQYYPVEKKTGLLLRFFWQKRYSIFLLISQSWLFLNHFGWRHCDYHSWTRLWRFISDFRIGSPLPLWGMSRNKIQILLSRAKCVMVFWKATLVFATKRIKIFLYIDQSFSIVEGGEMWATLLPYHQWHLMMSGDIFGDHNLEEGEKLLLPSGG